MHRRRTRAADEDEPATLVAWLAPPHDQSHPPPYPPRLSSRQDGRQAAPWRRRRGRPVGLQGPAQGESEPHRRACAADQGVAYRGRCPPRDGLQSLSSRPRRAPRVPSRCASQSQSTHSSFFLMHLRPSSSTSQPSKWEPPPPPPRVGRKQRRLREQAHGTRLPTVLPHARCRLRLLRLERRVEAVVILGDRGPTEAPANLPCATRAPPRRAA